MNLLSHRTRLTLEPLEARETPAGVVDVTFARGAVTVIGDAEGNYIDVSTDVDQRIVIGDATHGTTFRLNGADPAAIVILPAELTGGMTFRMGDGADTLKFNDVLAPASLRIDGGEGNNSIMVYESLWVVKNLTVTNGAGKDELQVRKNLEVGGRLSINNRDGDSVLVGQSDSYIKAASLNLTNGIGYDSVQLLGLVVVLNNMSIRNGAGGSFLGDAPFSAIGVGGTLSVINGAGEDIIGMEQGLSVRAGGNIVIRNGPGYSDTILNPTAEIAAGRNLIITGGPDVHRVQIGGTTVTAGLSVRGNFIVNWGDGGGGLEVLVKVMDVKGGINVRAGSGQDSVDIVTIQEGKVGGGVAIGLGPGDSQQVKLQNLAIGSSLRVSTAAKTFGNESDLVSLLGVSVGGNTSITTGAANDQVAVSASTFGGRFALSTGVGNDSVAIEWGTGVDGVTQFNGAVNVRTGRDNDSVYVGYNALPFGPFALAIFAAASTWDGGPDGIDQVFFDSANVFNGPQPTVIGFDV